MSVTENQNKCSHPNCENYSDAASTPCNKCDQIFETGTKCSYCGQRFNLQ